MFSTEDASQKTLRGVFEVDGERTHPMISDEERREVAHNIRENCIRGGLGYKVASAYNIAMAIGMNPGVLVGDIELWNRLADLIDPDNIPDNTDENARGLSERCDRDALLGSLSKRLMPEGMEWPRFEDGEQVKFGDEVHAENEPPYPSFDIVIDRIALDHSGFFTLFDDGNCEVEYRIGERVKRPAPKVLAADGEPLEVGQTVYKLDDDRPYTLEWFDGDHVYINAGGSSFDIWTFPNKLTHERPDSWERIEEDAGKNPFDYCKAVGHRLDTCENSEAYKARDLVRRAKLLYLGRINESMA